MFLKETGNIPKALKLHDNRPILPFNEMTYEDIEDNMLHAKEVNKFLKNK